MLKTSAAVYTIFELQLLASKDQKLLYQLDFEDEQLLYAKVSVSGVTTVPTKEEAEVHNYKQLLDEVFHDIQNYQGWGKHQADNTYQDLDNSGYHKKPNSMTVLLYTDFSKEILSRTKRCNTSEQGSVVFFSVKYSWNAWSLLSLTFLCSQHPYLQPVFHFPLQQRSKSSHSHWLPSVSYATMLSTKQIIPVAVRPCSTHDKVSRITCSSHNKDWDFSVQLYF